MNEFIALLLPMSCTYIVLEIVIERKLKIRERLFDKIGKFLTCLLGTLLTVSLIFFILPYKEVGNLYSAMLGIAFGFYYYSALYKLGEFFFKN